MTEEMPKDFLYYANLTLLVICLALLVWSFTPWFPGL